MQANKDFSLLSEHMAEVFQQEDMLQLRVLQKTRKHWQAMVGDLLASSSEPFSIKSSTLVVGVAHPSQAQQIRFLSKEILTACCQLNRVSITKIRTKMVVGARCMEGAGKKALPNRQPTLSELKDIARSLQHIQDKDLRKAIFDARKSELSYPFPV